MEIGEEDEVVTELRVLARERLLDLEHELGLIPDLVDRPEPGADEEGLEKQRQLEERYFSADALAKYRGA